MAILPPDPCYIFRENMGHIHNLCFAKKSDNYCSQLLAATERGIIYFWDLESNRLQHKQEMGESIQAIHYHDDNIITQEKMGTVKLWTVKKSSYTMVTTYSGGVGFCKSVVLNNSLLVPQEDGGVDILDITSLEKVQRLMPEIESIGKLMCLESLEIDGNVCVLGGYESGDVVLWDMNSFKPCANIRLQEHITSITFDTDNGRGVVGGPSNILQMFEIDKSYKMILRSEISMTNEGVNIVKLRPDKKIMVTGGWDGRIRIYSWKTMRILVTLPEHKAAITDVQFSPCILSVWGAKIIAASGTDGIISLWNIYN